MMSEFVEAQRRVKQLRETPQKEELLELYALFKQATIGDCTGKRPSLLDARGRAKFDGWSRKKGTTQGEAELAYVERVRQLEVKYGRREA